MRQRTYSIVSKTTITDNKGNPSPAFTEQRTFQGSELQRINRASAEREYGLYGLSQEEAAFKLFTHTDVKRNQFIKAGNQILHVREVDGTKHTRRVLLTEVKTNGQV